MHYVGIDPGLKAGAIAVLNERGRVLELVAMPMIGSGGRGFYDIDEVKALLLRHIIEGGEISAAIERLNAMPPSMGGAWTNHGRGKSWIFDGLFKGMGIAFQPVAPKTWQRVMHEGTGAGDLKKRSIAAAKNLFPGIELRRETPTGRRSRKADDGLAEALLIAEWWRRRHRGVEAAADKVPA